MNCASFSRKFGYLTDCFILIFLVFYESFAVYYNTYKIKVEVQNMAHYRVVEDFGGWKGTQTEFETDDKNKAIEFAMDHAKKTNNEVRIVEKGYMMDDTIWSSRK